MSFDRDDMDNAFPGWTWVEDGRGGRVKVSDPGMTLRDYFAAKAMQAMLSTEFQMSGSVTYIDRNGGKLEDHVSACAYDMADAMLKAREE